MHAEGCPTLAGSLKLQVTGLSAAQVGTNNCTETWLGPGICDLRLAAVRHIVLTVRQGGFAQRLIISAQFAFAIF